MKKLYYLSPLILQTLIWIPTRIYFKLFYSYSVKGLNNLKELNNNKNPKLSKMNGRGGVIFAVNHTSELDPIMIPASLPFLSHMMPMFYVSREQKFYSRSGWRQHIYGGRFFNAWGAYTVYVGLKDYEKSLRHHIDILNDGRSLCIFPEGIRSDDGSVKDGKPGVGFLSYRTKSVVVPVKINGLYKPFAKKDKLGRVKLDVIFGRPLYPKDLFKNTERGVDIEDFKNATNLIMDKIRRL